MRFQINNSNVEPNSNQVGVPPHTEEEEKKVTIKLRPRHQAKPEERKIFEDISAKEFSELKTAVKELHKKRGFLFYKIKV